MIVDISSGRPVGSCSIEPGTDSETSGQRRIEADAAYGRRTTPEESCRSFSKGAEAYNICSLYNNFVYY